jgi:hypothetical protein
MEDISRITVSSCLGCASCDNNPNFMALTSFDSIIKVLDAFITQVSLRCVAGAAIGLIVAIVPEDSD